MKFIKFVLFSFVSVFFFGCGFIPDKISNALAQPFITTPQEDFNYCYGEKFIVVNKCDLWVIVDGNSPHNHHYTITLSPRGTLGSSHIYTFNPVEFNGAGAVFTAMAQGAGSTSHVWTSSNSAYNLGYPANYPPPQTWEIREGDLR